MQKNCFTGLFKQTNRKMIVSYNKLIEFIRVFSHDFKDHNTELMIEKIYYLKNAIVEMKRKPGEYFINNQKEHDYFCLIVNEEIDYLRKKIRIS